MPDAHPTLQYYDGRFTGEEGNMVYNNLINCVPTKPPYYNDSIRNVFTQSSSEKGDKQIYFVQKRKGFKRIKMYTNGVEDTATEWVDCHVTDMKVVDGYRYFIVLNDSKTKLRIYKQIDLLDLTLCNNNCIAKLSQGRIENITLYKGENHFPFNACLYDKFLLTTHVKGKSKQTSITGVASAIRTQDTYMFYLYNADTAEPVNAST